MGFFSNRRDRVKRYLRFRKFRKDGHLETLDQIFDDNISSKEIDWENVEALFAECCIYPIPISGNATRLSLIIENASNGKVTITKPIFEPISMPFPTPGTLKSTICFLKKAEITPTNIWTYLEKWECAELGRVRLNDA